MPVQVLERHCAKAQQVGLNRAMRCTNLHCAFHLSEAEKAGLVGRHILLVDRVLTTSAALEARIRTPFRVGAEAIDFVTLARVVMP